MSAVSLNEILLTMSASTFLMGLITFSIGVFILVSRATGSAEIQSLTRQTTRLAQKGLAEEIAGLVGNASQLLETLSEMVRTAAGIGVFLAVNGSLLMGAGIWLLLQVL